ncbi:hypothetical protein ACA910_006071 [Epithemia clementina (nom. ined.)]
MLTQDESRSKKGNQQRGSKHGSLHRCATLQDFVNFHGMLCRPSTAQRCIDEFHSGTVLFMPNDYNRMLQQNHLILNNNNYTNKSAAPPLSLANVFAPYDFTLTLTTSSYYALVLVTFTGLLTWLGLTKFLVGREKVEPIIDSSSSSLSRRVVAESNPHLVIEPCVLDYIRIEQNIPSTSNFFVKRQFEYNFGGMLLVMMIHLGVILNDGSSDTSDAAAAAAAATTHLVEVYRIQPTIVRVLYRYTFSLMSWCCRRWMQRTPHKPTAHSL